MKTLVITGTVITRTALHIGSGLGSGEADSLLRRNVRGEIFLPGSAIAGPLRSLATRLAPRLEGQRCKSLLSQLELNARDEQGKDAQGRLTACSCAACHLFGAVDPQEANEEVKGGRAARLWVYDAPLVEATPTNIRDSVGIDRRTGAAARVESIKFDLEVLPAGAAFDLRLELEDPSGLDEPLLAAVLAEWQAGRAALGGRVARGLGAFALDNPRCSRRDLSAAAALISFLRSDDPLAGLAEEEQWFVQGITAARQAVRAGPPEPHTAQSWVEVEMTLQATGPLLAGDITRARRGGFDHAPLIERSRPIVPGASLRGVLRSHAERIARTLSTIKAQDGLDFGKRCPACSPVARPRNPDQQVPLQVCDSLLKRMLEVDEEAADADLCLACRLFGSALRGSRLVIEDAALKAGTDTVFKVQDFLAIDRFTGGGRDGAKFDAVGLWRPAFTARLRLENPQAWELGWLALVLRDLAEGWLSVGFGRAKGYGQVTVPDWTVRIGFLQPEDFPAADGSAVAADDALQGLLAIAPEVPFASIYRVRTVRGQTVTDNGRPRWQLSEEDVAATWHDQVSRWVKAFNRQVQGFSRSEGRLPKLDSDTYFTGKIDQLYPKPVGGKQP